MDALMNVDASDVMTMSSLEIAELTGKRHDHVLRDIENMLKELEIGHPIFGGTYLSIQNKELPCFNLPKRETLILVSGYSIELRARIIDRWQELEQEQQKQQFSVPQTLGEALRLAADLSDRNVELTNENLLLTSKIEQDKDKVLLVDRMESSELRIGITLTAKVLNIGSRYLHAWLRDNDWTWKNGRNKNAPKQPYLKNKYLTSDVVPFYNVHTQSDDFKIITMITVRGMKAICRAMNIELTEQMLKNMEEAAKYN